KLRTTNEGEEHVWIMHNNSRQLNVPQYEYGALSTENFWRFKQLEIDTKIFEGRLVRKLFETRLRNTGDAGTWKLRVTSHRLDDFKGGES
ncbi:hypothetical protein PFISCL1PPCAC_3861, partial [Pristionchus fissidentatus]